MTFCKERHPNTYTDKFVSNHITLYQKLKHIKRIDINCDISDLVQALPDVEIVEINLVLYLANKTLNHSHA